MATILRLALQDVTIVKVIPSWTQLLPVSALADVAATAESATDDGKDEVDSKACVLFCVVFFVITHVLLGSNISLNLSASASLAQDEADVSIPRAMPAAQLDSMGAFALLRHGALGPAYDAWWPVQALPMSLQAQLSTVPKVDASSAASLAQSSPLEGVVAATAAGTSEATGTVSLTVAQQQTQQFVRLTLPLLQRFPEQWPLLFPTMTTSLQSDVASLPFIFTPELADQLVPVWIQFLLTLVVAQPVADASASSSTEATSSAPTSLASGGSTSASATASIPASTTKVDSTELSTMVRLP